MARGAADKHKPRPRRVIRQIADLTANTLDLEVVVLEEINTSSQEYRWLETDLGRYGYHLRQAGDVAEQDVVIAFDTDEIELLGGEVHELNVRADFSLPGNCRTSRSLRRPIAAHLRAGNFDFLVVGVHLKSQLSVEAANDPDGCADAIRFQQCEDIKREIPRLYTRFREQDVIIVGDFNATLEDSSLAPLLLSPASAH